MDRCKISCVDICRKDWDGHGATSSTTTVTRRAWALARPLTTAHGVETTVDVVVAEIADGEGARPRRRRAASAVRREALHSVVATLDAIKGAVYSGLDRDALQSALPPGAARNALDCAFWDIDAKRAYRSVAELAGLGAVTPVVTAFTLDFYTPEKMAEQAAAHCTRPLFRLELGGDGDVERVRAVREAAPGARLVVDANESWNGGRSLANTCLLLSRSCGVELIEQPLPAEADDTLLRLEHPIPLCADVSCRDGGRSRSAGRKISGDHYQARQGGWTDLRHSRWRRKRGGGGLRIMVGGVIGTSLGVAPALLVAQQADVVGLDGPLRLAVDRGAGLQFDGKHDRAG